METKRAVTNDFRKWLLYSYDKRDYKDYYDLYKALNHRRNSGAVAVIRNEVDGVTSWQVSHEQLGEELQVNESQLEALLHYLVTNYFQTDDIDGQYREKLKEAEIKQNHQLLDKKPSRDEEDVVVNQHPKEKLYYNIKVAISAMVYAVFLGYTVYIGISAPMSLVLLIPVVGVILLLMLSRLIGMGIFVGIVRGQSIKVTREQYPEIFQIVEQQAKRLHLKALPDIYITAGHFNAFVTKFSRKHLLLLYSEVVETSLRGNYDVLKYVVGHELCHIKQNHIGKGKWLFPSSFIPFLNLAYSRGAEYTCDRVGYTFAPAGAVEGILVMTTGKEIHSKFDVELHIRNSQESEGFWSWLSEKFLSHPHHYKRLIEIKKYHKYRG